MKRPDPADHIIVHVGTNEIATRKPASKIANDITKISSEIKNEENSVSISGIIHRGNEDENFKVKQANDILKSFCSKNDFYFIDNSNISPKMLADGLHLDKPGCDILSANFLRNLIFCHKSASDVEDYPTLAFALNDSSKNHVLPPMIKVACPPFPRLMKLNIFKNTYQIRSFLKMMLFIMMFHKC